MKFHLLHPREQLVVTLQRIYDYGMTTTSGGNLSIMDDNGDIWITPTGVDKGSLRPEDIVLVKPDNSYEGLHKPSSEYPFHRAIYAGRPDIKSIVHAHPSALVSFSIVRQIPDTKVIAQANHVCGAVGYADYELPGSEALGDNIAKSFAEGYNVVLMENHGTVVGGKDLADAFQKFETLEFCARSIMEATAVGKPKTLTNAQLSVFENPRKVLDEFVHSEYSNRELELRAEICKIIHRAYRQRLIISTYGTLSTRLTGNDFLITPYGKDRYYLDRDEIVLIKNGKRESGKHPSRSVHLHKNIYQNHPDINCIFIAQSPFAITYAITGQAFDTRTIPESYILLRDVPLIPYGDQYETGDLITNTLNAKTPIVLIENDSILATGQNILQAFDRLEVAEFSARSLTQSALLGKMVPIKEKEIDDLKRKFLSE
ncbi:MAG: class II aldolase/adducin family protein [Cyclobacteriaceae bacterium]